MARTTVRMAWTRACRSAVSVPFRCFEESAVGAKGHMRCIPPCVHRNGAWKQMDSIETILMRHQISLQVFLMIQVGTQANTFLITETRGAQIFYFNGQMRCGRNEYKQSNHNKATNIAVNICCVIGLWWDVEEIWMQLPKGFMVQKKEDYLNFCIYLYISVQLCFSFLISNVKAQYCWLTEYKRNIDL